MVTFTIPTRLGARRRRSARAVESGGIQDYADIAAMLAKHGARHQFHPAWPEDTLRSTKRCRDLAAKDFFLCRDDTRVAGCLALWDQRSFKQTVIAGYTGHLGRIRPLFNIAAPLLGRPRLPAPGARLEGAFLSHVAVEPDDTETLVALVGNACTEAVRRGIDYVMIGFAERNPLAGVLQKRFPCHSYVSMVYVVYWEDGEAAASALDDRMPHPEMAIL